MQRNASACQRVDGCSGGRGVRRRSAAQARRLHQPIGRGVGFAHPIDDLVGLGGVFQLDADGAVDAEVFDFAQVGGEVDDAAAGGQVAVDFAVAIRDVYVDGLALESAQLLRRGAAELQVRDVDVGTHGGMIHVVDEADHAVHVVEQR